MILTEDEAKKIREKAAKKAAMTDLPRIRDRRNAKARRKSDKGIAKGGPRKRKSVRTVSGGQFESNRSKH